MERSTDRTNCTVVYAADGSIALGGNNEDGRNPLTRIWFVPGGSGSYGSVFVGYDDLVIQGGMNEAGLFFDALAVREVVVPGKPGKPTYTGQSMSADVMAACDSVRCVLERFEGVSMPGTWNGQYLFGDRFGDSAIVEPLAVIPKTGRFQVATNFFQSEVPAAERTDTRYAIATAMLAAPDAVSTDLIRDVLDATHQEGTAETLYSTVYDLRAQVVHVYYFHDFAAELTFDLGAELAKGVHGYDMTELFRSNQAAAERAAPIRAQLAATVGQLPAVLVAPDEVAELAGTYEGEYLTLTFEADDEGLIARLPWTPSVPLVAISPREFAHVFSDGEGAVHEQRLRFSVEGPGEQARVQIVEDHVGSIVATRASLSGTSVGRTEAVIALIAIAGAAVAAWAVARRVRAPRRQAARRPGEMPPFDPVRK